VTPSEAARAALRTRVAPPLLVPDHIVRHTYESFAPHRSRRVESIAYWYGVESRRANAVVSLAVPDAERSACHYDVDEDTVAMMGGAMIKNSLVCLAQFHTHPGQSTAHSRRDDRRAMSGRDGFLSLVAPWHGSAAHPFPDSVSVHEMRAGRWSLLGDDEKRDRVRVVDDVVELGRAC